VFIIRCPYNLQNCFCHPGMICIFKINILMIAQNYAINKFVVTILFTFSLLGFPLGIISYEI
jgi:hypothetical protein